MRNPQLTYYDLGERVTAFSTTRHGGASKGLYGELNLNSYCGDEPQDVEKNRAALCHLLNIPTEGSLIIPHQVHATETRIIDNHLLQLPTEERQQLLEGVDAVMTNVEDVCIGVSTADCIPILLYDPIHHCAAAIHAGWRGTVKRIAEKTALLMAETYHSEFAQIKAVIGPGISLKNFEVGNEVYDAFAEASFPMEKIATRQEKWHIDLPMCNRLQLEQLGIPKESIYDSGICTFSNHNDYFSARRLGISSGRIYTGIILRKQ